MKNYELNLFGVKRELPFIDLEDNLAFASFVIMGDTELIMACAPKLAEKIGDVDVIITAEAKGIALTYEISRILGKLIQETSSQVLEGYNSITSVLTNRCKEKHQILYERSRVGVGTLYYDFRRAALVPGRP